METYLIPLENDPRQFIVDVTDFERVSRLSWFLGGREDRETIYCCKDAVNISIGRFLMGEENELIDHIDRNPFNNKRENLRPASFVENARNRRPQRNKECPWKGVSFFQGKWRARITANGKTKDLGYFATEIDAGIAYDLAAMQLFGEFAYLNFTNHNIPELLRPN